MNRQLILSTTWLALAAPVFAQTNFPEVESNDSKATAQAINCMVANDTITGLSVSATTTGLDYYRVKTCALPLAIYRHRLSLTTSGTAGHASSIRWHSQAAGVPTGGEVAWQTASTVVNGDLPVRTTQWYGFGKQEEVNYLVTGTASTTANYVATLSTSTVTPGVIAGSFNPGTITVTSAGSTTADTEIYLYDGSLNPVALGHNDDLTGGIAGPSTVSLSLAAGTYYVAISNYNTANNQGDLNPAEAFQTGTLLDFPDVVANQSTSLTTNCNFTVSDGVTTTPVTTTHANGFQIMWFTFTVGTPAVFASFCSGDGTLTDHTTPCPCGNNGAAGNGCANSVNANGANLTATGSAALDNVVLNGSGMPLTVSCIYLQGDALNDGVFGDGVRCAGGTLIRLRTKTNAGGASAFPDSTDTITLSARGGVTVGSGVRRYYQTYYRNSAAGFCPPETFNVTNGWKIDW